jgi:D-glycero-alpha-D-manno-heptose-7-phosphate kinase
VGDVGQIYLRSEDQNVELRFGSDSLFDEGMRPAPQVELHFKLLRHFAQEKVRLHGAKFPFKQDIKLSTRAKSPAGAGLGGSSALNIATVGALATWARERAVDILTEGERLIEVARDVETTVIKVPAGLQDYYAAMFGGLQAIEWGIGVHHRQWLPEKILAELEKRLLLFYSGHSRNSGINNWTLFKSLIDKQAGVQTKFQNISDATVGVQKCLVSGDWKAAGRFIADEWATRKTLAPSISTAEMEAAFAKARDEVPHVSGKVCGAGGGGCFFFYTPDGSDAHRHALSTLNIPGIVPLPFKAVPRGLEVWVNRA